MSMAGGSFTETAVNGIHAHATNGTVHEGVMTTTGLRALQSVDEKRLFDIVDKLRLLDINHELDLPQLVVCGSQSSGKSSVLEAISHLPFPRADMTCTRFVTEIQYRRREEKLLQVEIVPDQMRPPKDQKILEQARFVARDLNQLPNIIKEAEKQLGLSGNQGFAKDVLRVQITGPEYQPLTLVDLPGLIESHSQGSHHIRLVKEIVDYWIKEKRSIILAVVEAGSDPERQGILTRAKEVDPSGERTFGIITKPDVPEPGSQLEGYWINHARNTQDGRAEFHFKKGWHVLRNRNYAERQASTTNRDETEKQFFRDPNRNWHVVDPRYWGIDSLRQRLRTLLYEHTKKQLPQVRRDIAAKLDRYNKDLRSLDVRLQRPDKLWADYNRECKELAVVARIGVDGKFNHAFFADWDGEATRNIRSRIEKANDTFFDDMTTNGHGLRIPGTENPLSDDPELYHEEVKRMLRETRGEELPGHYDWQRVNLLFRKHSVRWHSIAQTHVERAFGHCQAFVAHMINGYFHERLPGLPKFICDKMVEHLEKSLEQQKDLATKELDTLEADRNRSVKTRNKDFELRSRRHRAEQFYTTAMRTFHSEDEQIATNGGRTSLKTPMYLEESFEQEAGASAARKLGDDMLIYYDIARDVFVDNILVQVIERHLLAPLHTLFHGDFDIKQAAFYDMLNDEDNRALEAEKLELEAKIKSLRGCQAELM